MYHRQDCGIIRIGDQDASNYQDEFRFGTSAIMVDEEGEVIFGMPNPMTDEQMWHILDLINKFKRIGFDSGTASKAREIRIALGALASGDC